MRSLFIAFLFLLFLSAIPLQAQTATDVNEGCRLTPDATPGDYTLSWWGKNGHTYFIQHSDDLVTWTYVPLIESGAAEVTEYGFTSTAQKSFFRLRASDAATGGDPETADFDGDGLTNLQEIDVTGTHTDPLVADTDGDGASDGAEHVIGSSPINATSTVDAIIATRQAQVTTQMQDLATLEAQNPTTAAQWAEVTALQTALAEAYLQFQSWAALLGEVGSNELQSQIEAMDTALSWLENPVVHIAGRESVHLLSYGNDLDPTWRTYTLNPVLENAQTPWKQYYNYWPPFPYASVLSELVIPGFGNDEAKQWLWGWGYYSPTLCYSGMKRLDQWPGTFPDRQIEIFGSIENYGEPTQVTRYYGKARQYWLQTDAPVTEECSRSFVKVTEVGLTQSNITSRSVELVIMTIPIFKQVSNVVELQPPATPNAYARVSLLPIEVKVVKKGTAAAPEKGLIVKKGDIVKIRCSPLPQGLSPIQASGMTWLYSKRLMDGEWDVWTPFGGSNGVNFEHTMEDAGIYRVKVWIQDLHQNMQTEGFELLRKRDEKEGNIKYGNGKAGQFDCFGVAENETDMAIVQEAQSFLASTAYASSNVVPAQYGFPAYDTSIEQSIRCNIFVAHRASAAGAIVPKINGYLFEYPPLANQWAGTQDTSWWSPLSFDTDIAYWNLWNDLSFLPMKPGRIIGHPAAGDAGHCAIIDYDGEGIGAGSDSGTVNKLYPWFFDGTSGHREYYLDP